MPLIPYSKEEEIAKCVRRAMIKDPMYTVTSIQRALTKDGYFGLHGGAMDHRYVRKLIRKVQQHAQKYASRELEIERIAKTRERFALVSERLFKIAFWDFDSLQEMIPMPTVAEQISALKAIVELDLKIFEAEKIAGLFMQTSENIIEGQWRYREMPSEYYELMVQAFAARGFGPDRLRAIQDSVENARKGGIKAEHGPDTTSAVRSAPSVSTELAVVG